MTPEDAPPETPATAPPATAPTAGATHVVGPTPPPVREPLATDATGLVGSHESSAIIETDVLGPGTAARFLEGVHELEPGSELGPYRIVSILGRGGMGLVYRAIDPRLAREVALKTLPGTADRAQLERFLREARAAARLKHPGIVGVHEVNVYSGRRVIALELVEGESLAQRLAREGPLEPMVAAALVRGIALAVAAAHASGIVHRDLKPANVLLDSSADSGTGAVGRPRLADFGLARDDRATSLTTTGEILGTPAYMSPEQASGESDAVGPRTDIYGLGTILFETLAGRAPFTGRNAIEVIRKVAEQPPDSLDDLRRARGLPPAPEALASLCRRALAKSPDARPASAAAFARELEAFERGEPAAVPPAPAVKTLEELPSPLARPATPALPDAAPVGGLGRRVLAFVLDYTIAALAIDLCLTLAHERTWTEPRGPLGNVLLGFALLGSTTLLGATRGGATLGQLIVGIRITTLEGGSPSLATTLLRTLSSLLVLPTLGLGFILGGQNGQALHDRIAKTRVVRRRRADGRVSGPSTLVLGVGAWALGMASIVGLTLFAIYKQRKTPDGLAATATASGPLFEDASGNEASELGRDLFDWTIRTPSGQLEHEVSPFTLLAPGKLRIVHLGSENEPVILGKRRDARTDASYSFRARSAPGSRTLFLGRLRAAGPGASVSSDMLVLSEPGLADALLPETGAWVKVELRVTGKTWEVSTDGSPARVLVPRFRGLNGTGGFGFLVQAGTLEVEDVRSRAVEAPEGAPRDTESERGKLLHRKLRRLLARPGVWTLEALDDKGQLERSVDIPKETVEILQDPGALHPSVITLTVPASLAAALLPPATAARRSTLRLVVAGVAIPIEDFRREPGGRALMTSIDARSVSDDAFGLLDAAIGDTPPRR